MSAAEIELRTNLAWDLNENLKIIHRQLYIRLSLENFLEKAHPGEEVVDLLDLLYKRQRRQGLNRFYKLIEKLGQEQSLHLINSSTAAELFRYDPPQPQPQPNNNNNNNNYNNNHESMLENTNYKPSSVTKFLMVPNDDLNLSTSLDVVLTDYDYYVLHECNVYVIWKNKIHDEKTDCSRYVLKFFVGNAQIYTKTSDALKHANEVLFLLTKNVECNNYITINGDNDIEAHSQIPVSTCLSLLLYTLQGLKRAVPYAFYGVMNDCLPLKQDVKLLQWMTGTSRAVVGRSYFCFKFHNNGQDPKKIGPEVTDTVTARTIEGEFEGPAIQSINVYISGTTLLPVMIQLHKEDIYYDLLAKHSLRLISINEICVQDVEDVRKDPRNEVYRADLEAMIERMKRDGVRQTFDEGSKRITHSFGSTDYIGYKILATERAKRAKQKSQSFRTKPVKLVRTQDEIRNDLDLYTNVEALKKHLFGENPEPKFVFRLFFANFSPLSSITDVQTSIGAPHAGLQINEKLVHWLENGLVMITKKPKLSSCFMVLSPSQTRSVLLTEDIATKICQTIVEWNASTYNHVNRSCYQFVSEIIRNVIPNYKPDNMIARFIHEMITGDAVIQEEGQVHHITFHLPSVPYKISFSTHDELDMLQGQLQKYNPTENELKFLKTFHRGFQVKELTDNSVRFCVHYGSITIGSNVPEVEEMVCEVSKEQKTLPEVKEWNEDHLRM